MALIQRGFQAYDGNNAPDFVKNGNFVLNNDISRAQGLVGWLPLIGPRGAHDHSLIRGLPSVDSASVTGNVSFKASEFGADILAISRSGTNGFVDLGDRTDIIPANSDWTVAFWGKIKTADIGTDSRMTASWLDGPDEFHMSFWFDTGGANDSWAGSVNATNTIGADSDNFVADTWQRVTLTFEDDVALNLYVDQALSDTDNTPGSSEAFTGLVLGTRETALGGECEAEMFGYEIHNRVLSEFEIFASSHPSTLWDMYYETGKVAYFFAPAAAAVGSFPPYTPPPMYLLTR